MKLVQHTAFLKDGRVHIRHRKLFDKLCAQFREGAELLVTVERVTATRSPEANRFYWAGLVTPIAEATGHTKNEMHEILKRMFLPHVVLVPGKGGVIVAEFQLGGSTRKLDKNEFYEYMEEIRAWASTELGLVFPERDPDRLVL